jgi:phosphatidylinositol dimannoside acyltransferase
VHVHPEIAVPPDGRARDKAAAMTQQVAQVFEQAIRQHPQDWHMLQPVFMADLDQARLAAARKRAAASQRVPGANGSGPTAGEPAAGAGAT